MLRKDGKETGITATNIFYIEQDGEKHIAYCLQSIWSTPNGEADGKDAVEALNDENQSLQKILYYGYGGPDDISQEFFTAERMAQYEGVKNWDADEFRYLITHCTASYAYFENYMSWAEITGKPEAEDMTSFNVGTWGLTDAAKQLVLDYYNWIVARELPNTLFVNDNVGNDGTTGDIFVLNGRTNTQNPIGITFVVPDGWVYKNDSKRVPGEDEVTALRQQEFAFSLADDMQQINPVAVPSITVKGVVNGSSDESWKAVITSGQKGAKNEQDLGGISYSQLATEGTEVEFNLQAQEGTLDIQKTDENGAPLAGAKFCLYYDAACTKPLVADMEQNPLVTDADGNIDITFLITETIENTQTIYVKEVEAPAGYYLAGEVYTVSLTNGNGSLTVTNEAATGKLKLYKNGEVFKGISEEGLSYTVKGLAGAEFALYAKDDLTTPVKVFVTDAEGYAEAGDIPLGEYILKETKAPTGYVLDKTEYAVTFTQTDQTVKEIVVEQAVLNERYTFEIAIQKVDAKDMTTPVAGAEFGLYAAADISGTEGTLAAGTLIETASSGADGKAIFSADIPMGKYYVKEIAAPTGYALSDEIIEIDLTNVDSDEKVVKCEYLFTEEAIELKIDKVDSDDISKEIEGAELTLYGQDEKGEYTVVVDRWETKADEVHDVGSKLTAGNSYLLRETKVPEGYEQADDILFEIQADGTVITEADKVVKEDGTTVYVMKDKKIIITEVIEEDGGKSVKTGDTMPMELYGMLLMFAAVVMVSILKKRRI